MKKQSVSFVLLFSITLFFNHAFSQDIGSIFCWHYKEIYGGHDHLHNESITKRLLGGATKWPNNIQWWENMAEEIDYSGLDYVALLSRGNQPNAPDRGNGNPKHIPKLLNALKVRGANSVKIAIFDDVPNSWSASKNWNESGGKIYSPRDPKFDCSNPDNYKYIWDYNIKQVYEHVPDEMRYKIDDRPVIFFWNLRDTWFTNIEGNLKPILEYIRAQCQAEFGFNPFLIVQTDWFNSDPQLRKSDVDAVHHWTKNSPEYGWTLTEENNYKIGVLHPGLRNPGHPEFADPSMGTDDNGALLKDGLENTVGTGARTTLIEGFTNAAESAALWRSNDEGLYLLYDYPNQRLNIVRRYTTNPYPDTLKLEAEACDFHYDLTFGNSGGAFLYMGDLDVLKCYDTHGGWYVTNTEADEWMEWKELPLLADTKFELRYKSKASSSVKITIDDNDLPTARLPSTDGVWSSIHVGTKSFPSNGLHDVRLTVVSGSPDINYFNMTSGDISNSLVDLPGDGQKDIRIYPNPADNFVKFIPNEEITEISLYSKTGVLQMKRVYDTENEIELNVSNINPGLYILNINNKPHKLIIK
ncbi:MAG: DUF5010 domain-containing protein [Prolixibacteraceae bacterium]|nr:DUF5010 domain-containing protein [Prolixibacteraceae bacterium]